MTTEQTLNEFLLARIAEDEEAARKALAVHPGWLAALVLAGCAATRKIMELHPARWIYVEANRKMGEESPQVECVGGPVYDDEVRILGEVYAAHEDYRVEWRQADAPFDHLTLKP